MELKKRIEEIYAHIVDIRREIHQEPEIGMEVDKTIEKICRELDALGVSYRRTDHQAIIAEIKGEKEASDKVVMLRADMDALPVEEKTNLPYCSKEKGKMHACGHDLHVAMLLGAVNILKQLKTEFSGTVRFLFQPAEEIVLGAKYMIEDGALENVSMGFGLHVDPLKAVGEFAIAESYDWASCDRLEIKVHGVSAHGATPQKGRDALVCASSIVMNLQSIVSREVNPMYPLVITIGSFHSGSAFNVISEEATLIGTCRTFEKEVYDLLPEAIDRVAKHIAKAYGCEAEVTLERLTQPLINHPKARDCMRSSAKKVLEKEDDLKVAEREMIGEDFAEFAELIPCCFGHLGANGAYPLHNGHVNFDEKCMKYGIAIEVQSVIDALNQ